ncbi:MAG: SDR family NAD(P)-dependent oxidoreductase [Pseudomonadota bacterium]
MSKPAKALVVGVSAKAGLGAALCRKFAAEGLHVLAAGRSADRLGELVQDIEAAGGQAQAVVMDTTVEADVTAAFDRAFEDDAQSGPAGIVVYNAGNNARGDLGEMTNEFFEQVWRVTCLGGFMVAREATRRLRQIGRGTVIFTGATASLRSRPPFTAFASGKAALRAVAQSMARDMGPRGVHVAHVIVDGGINGERLRSVAPQRAEELGGTGLLDPDAIAEVYWHLHMQHPTTWTFELDVRPSVESF